ncbi:unnamed protein product [Symbiodinium sp. CCMP2456]|nr:unnamed protein product [Symbiodinium sp. CCMP2456]
MEYSTEQLMPDSFTSLRAMVCMCPDRPRQRVLSDGTVYVAFLAVGTSCGWFVINGLFNLIANEPEVSQGGKMMGEVTLVGSIVSLLLCGCYVLWMITFGKPARRTEQRWSSGLIVLGVISFAMLAMGWDVGPPSYPMVLATAVTGSIVGNASILMLFPLISTYYGGWLVAPVRAGTDISSMFTAFLAQLQSPDGETHTFPTCLLFVFYTMISCLGLVAWTVILRKGIGLREKETPTKSLDAPRMDVEPDARRPPPQGLFRAPGSPRQMLSMRRPPRRLPLSQAPEGRMRGTRRRASAWRSCRASSARANSSSLWCLPRSRRSRSA